MSVEYGRFDIALLCSPQTESGRNLGNEGELIGVMAKCLFLLGQTPVREAAFGATNNLARALASATADGSLKWCGAPAIAVSSFRSTRVAHYLASVAGENVIAAWADAAVADDLDGLLKDASNRHRFHDLNSYMSFVYQAAEGEETLGDFADEAAGLLRAKKVKAKELETQLEKFEKGFRARRFRVVAGSQGRADSAASALIADIEAQAVNIVDDAGPCRGPGSSRSRSTTSTACATNSKASARPS